MPRAQDVHTLTRTPSTSPNAVVMEQHANAPHPCVGSTPHSKNSIHPQPSARLSSGALNGGIEENPCGLDTFRKHCAWLFNNRSGSDGTACLRVSWPKNGRCNNNNTSTLTTIADRRRCGPDPSYQQSCTLVEANGNIGMTANTERLRSMNSSNH